MKDELFFSLDEPFTPKDSKKRKYVPVRMEPELFGKISEKAKEDQSDTSSVIRELLRNGLRKDTHEI